MKPRNGDLCNKTTNLLKFYYQNSTNETPRTKSPRYDHLFKVSNVINNPIGFASITTTIKLDILFSFILILNFDTLIVLWFLNIPHPPTKIILLPSASSDIGNGIKFGSALIILACF